MPTHRIKEYRELHGLTQEELGELVGRKKGAISRIESGETGLDLTMAEQIAAALREPLEKVLGLNSKSAGFYGLPSLDELEPYTGDPSIGLGRADGRHQYLMRVKADSLSQLGVSAGDVAFINNSRKLIKDPPPLARVCATYHLPEPEDREVIIIRQFVPPSLLTTNAGVDNAMPIDLEREPVTITGIIEWVARIQTETQLD